VRLNFFRQRPGRASGVVSRWVHVTVRAAGPMMSGNRDQEVDPGPGGSFFTPQGWRVAPSGEAWPVAGTCAGTYWASDLPGQPPRLPARFYRHTAGTPEDALDTACGFYLGDPTAWITPPKN
jgi:hypothetical protein